MNTIKDRYVLVTVCGVLLLGLVTAVATAFAPAKISHNNSHKLRPTTYHVSQTGKVIALSAAASRRLEGIPTKGNVSLLSVRAGRAFYGIGDIGANCFATGDASDIGDLQSVMCFESTTPLMDMSIYDVTPGTSHLFLLQGIAADQVSQIAVIASDGHVAARVPVVRNVYALAPPPAGEVRRLIAFDASGKEIGST